MNYSVLVKRSGMVELTIQGHKFELYPSDVAHIARCVLRGLQFHVVPSLTWPQFLALGKAGDRQ